MAPADAAWFRRWWTALHYEDRASTLRRTKGVPLWARAEGAAGRSRIAAATLRSCYLAPARAAASPVAAEPSAGDAGADANANADAAAHEAACEEGESLKCTVTFRANPAHNLTCAPSYICRGSAMRRTALSLHVSRRGRRRAGRRRVRHALVHYWLRAAPFSRWPGRN